MADDPNRDILPVREGSCVDTYRSSIDPRERHLVCKLDRYQLEDKYLRLLDEAYNLKKSYNCQEDKLKKLGTKLMRVSANPRSFPTAFDVCDDRNKIALLESENSKLKDKLVTLRSQLLNHTLSGRSCSRGRRPQTGPSSGPVTCRSEIGRPKVSSCQCIVQAADDEAESQNHLAKIEELEMQRKDMALRISQLERELAACEAGNQREKASENVEYIRVWRQMKQLNDKLITAQETNETLRAQINDLKKVLEETTKNNQQITASLMSEKKRMSEIDEQLIQSRDSQLTIREKDEQIRDLMSELRILQQHNNELIGLSSRYGQVEMENRELKKKVSEQQFDQQSFKTMFSTEHANITALQNINEQLLSKLHELQKNIDSLTIQLASFQKKNGGMESWTMDLAKKDERNVAANDPPIALEQSPSLTEKCRKCCEAYEKIFELEKALRMPKNAAKVLSVHVQTEKSPSPSYTKEQGTATNDYIIEKRFDERSSTKQQFDDSNLRLEGTLTPKKMLQLLEQVQINTCPEAARLGLQELTRGNDCGGTLELSRKNSSADVSCGEFCKTSMHFKRSAENAQAVELEGSAFAHDSNRIISSFYNILQEYNTCPPLCSDRVSQPYRKLYRDQLLDVGKKSSTSQTDVNDSRKGCSLKKHCSNVYGKEVNYDCPRIRHVDIEGVRVNHPVAKLIEPDEPLRIQNLTDKCTCNHEKKCYSSTDLVFRCCDTCLTHKSLSSHTGHSSLDTERQDEKLPAVERKKEDGERDTHDAYQMITESDNKHYDEDLNLQESLNQLIKCRELLKTERDLNTINGLRVNARPHLTETENISKSGATAETLDDFDAPENVKSSCSVNCPNECPSFHPNSFPLIITDNQGLLEIHILSLQLSTSAGQILIREGDIRGLSMFISWNILNEIVYTPPMKCPKLNFNSSFVFRIPELFMFFDYVLTECVDFHVNVLRRNHNPFPVARTKLRIDNILDYPQNKLHHIAPVKSIIPCSFGMTLGQLSLWIRLSCDLQKVEAFKNQRGIHSQVEYSNGTSLKTILEARSKEGLDTIEEGRDYVEVGSKQKMQEVRGRKKEAISFENNRKVFSEEIDNGNSVQYLTSENRTSVSEREETLTASPVHVSSITDNETNSLPAPGFTLGYVPKLKTRSSSISESMDTEEDSSDNGNAKSEKMRKERTKQDENPAKKENGLQVQTPSIVEFNSLLTNKTIAGQKTSDDQPENDVEIYSQQKGDTIIIEIVSMNLFQGSTVMNDDEVKTLYIEYSFLGHRGEDMETKSLPKSTDELIYNFRKQFKIDEERHSLQRNTLRGMLDGSIDPNIKFTVVSEPLVEETETKECVDVGFANFNIKEDYSMSDYHKQIILPISNMNDDERIGTLKIAVWGLDVIRQCLVDEGN